jgi:hypothetical protein
LDIVLVGRSTLGPRDNVIEMDVVVLHWLRALATDLVLSLQHPELNRTGDLTTNVPQFLRLSEWFGHVENWAVMPKDPTTLVRLRAQRKLFNQGTVRAILDLPARLADRLHTPLRVDLFKPHFEDTP